MLAKVVIIIETVKYLGIGFEKIKKEGAFTPSGLLMMVLDVCNHFTASSVIMFPDFRMAIITY